MIQPDGAQGEYVHVAAPASATVLAMCDDDQVVLARQWVYTHSGTEWRLPGGVVDASDDAPEQAARRELAAFANLRAERWEQIGLIHGADSLSNHVKHLFLARGLAEGPPTASRGEPRRVLALPFDEVVDLVVAGHIPHAGSAHAVLVIALRRAAQQGRAPA